MAILIGEKGVIFLSPLIFFFSKCGRISAFDFRGFSGSKPPYAPACMGFFVPPTKPFDPLRLWALDFAHPNAPLHMESPSTSILSLIVFSQV